MNRNSVIILSLFILNITITILGYVWVSNMIYYLFYVQVASLLGGIVFSILAIKAGNKGVGIAFLVLNVLFLLWLGFNFYLGWTTDTEVMNQILESQRTQG